MQLAPQPSDRLAPLAPLALMVCYCLGAQWLMSHAPRHLFTAVFVLAPTLLGVCVALWNAQRRGWALLLLAAAGGTLVALTWHGVHDIRPLYLAECVTIYSALFWLFWHSLRSGTPLITRLARTMHHLTPDMERYTAKLTRAWALYLAGMGLLSLLLFVLLPFTWWALYDTIISPLALGGFFIGEHLLRYRWHPEFERASLWASVSAWRQRGQGQ